MSEYHFLSRLSFLKSDDAGVGFCRSAKSAVSQKGFTLTELIAVVVLVGILAALGGLQILTPINSFVDVSRRAGLVDIADNALQAMTRELRNALPNSVRVRIQGSRVSLEFLNTITGGRYRARLEDDGSGDALINASTDTFDVLDGVAGAINAGPAGQANCINGNSDCLVLYNTGTGAGTFNAYNGDNIAAITAVDTVNNRLTFNNGGGWLFPFPIPPSSRQRFYVVDQPVSFMCDSASGQLRRYQDYGIAAVQPVTDLDFGGAGSLLADNITACQFDYAAGAGARHGLVTLRIRVQDVASGESVALLYQVHVLNIP